MVIRQFIRLPVTISILVLVVYHGFCWKNFSGDFWTRKLGTPVQHGRVEWVQFGLLRKVAGLCEIQIKRLAGAACSGSLETSKAVGLQRRRQVWCVQVADQV